MRAIYIGIFLMVLLATPSLAVDDFYGPQGGTAGVSGTDAGLRYPKVLGNSAWEELYVERLDLTGLMQRLYTVLTSPEHLGRYPQVAQVAELLKASGLFNLATVETKYAVTGDRMHCFVRKTFDGLDPQSFQAKLLALPNAKLRSAKYIAPEDCLMYCAVNNLPQMMMLQMEYMTQMAKAGGENGASGVMFGDSGAQGMEQALGMIKALKLDETLFKALSGEAGMVIYSLPDFDALQNGNLQPSDLDLALFLGINDKQMLTQLIQQFGGQAKLEQAEGPAGWQCYTIAAAPGVGLMFNDELFVVSPNLPRTQEHMQAARGKALRVGECQALVDINLAALHQKVIAPLAKLAAAELAKGVELPEKSMAYLVALPAEGDLGHLRIVARQGDNACESEVTLNKAVVQYAVYYLGLAACAAGQVEMKKHEGEKEEVGQGAVSEKARSILGTVVAAECAYYARFGTYGTAAQLGGASASSTVFIDPGTFDPATLGDGITVTISDVTASTFTATATSASPAFTYTANQTGRIT